mgnify:CR=1 FL=1|tara:strand:+ start:473 stop:1378 length:906 start_codon:yes stop_codon:yes gene_type:complete
MYKPQPVSEIVSEVIDADDPNCFSSFNDRKTTRHVRIREFAEKIKKVFPSCQFAKRGNHRPSIWVYHPNKSLCMGWIGYGNFKVNGSGEDTFVVCSRRIENGKYSSYSEQFYMVQNKQLDTAVRNARRYLRDYTPEEITSYYRNNCYNHWSTTEKGFNHDAQKARNAVVKDYYDDGDLLMRELVHLANSGHQWLNSRFTNFMDEFVKIDTDKKEAEALRDKRLYLVTTEVPIRGGGVQYRVCSIEDITNHPKTYPQHELFTDQTIDKELVGKLAVLEMCEIDQWVDGVGYKPVDNVYYVCR